jgi:Ca-activated chloride channel family protein
MPFLLVLLFFVFSVNAGPLAAQQDPVFRADTRLVVLHVTVMDRNGRLITDLPQKAFKVYENNVEQQVRLFRREDIPVSMGLIIDNSGSMRDKRKQVEVAAIQMVKASNPQDEVFVVNFNDEAYLDCPFTNSIPKLEEALSRIDQRGGTAMRDAISMSIDYMRENAKRDKKILMVVTDGDDNMSSITLEQLVQKAQQAEVLIYIARQVAHDIRNQYVIAYSPLNQNLDGTFRSIRVVAANGRYTVRTRTGYYATPEPNKRASR